MRFRVFKFGGASLANPESLAKVLEIVEMQGEGLCVVVSASRGVTDLLYKLYDGACQNQRDKELESLEQIRQLHVSLVCGLIKKEPIQAQVLALVAAMIEELSKICESLAVLREQSSKTLSKTVAFGERLMALVVSEVLRSRGQEVHLIDATQLIKLRLEKADYTPDDLLSKGAVESQLRPVLLGGAIAIVPGFFGAGPQGEVMILGRGGSDYSATLLGSYLIADEVCLFKEVDGILTADPRHVFDARVLPELHYREATELAYYGAKILHPRAIIPLVNQKIPLHLKNTFFPIRPGSRIAGDVAPGSFPVKALSYIDQQALISVEGKGMMGVPGIASKVFAALAQDQISICLITQASSEASISFVVPGDQGELAKRLLHAAFAYELERELMDDIKLRQHIAVLAVVGLGMSGTPGIAARAFTCVARQNINIIAIAQGSSELNISMVMEQHEAPRALRTLHREYGLEKIRPVLVRDSSEINLVIYGLGQIGRALLRQILEQREFLNQKLKFNLAVVGLVDRSGLQISDTGFSDLELHDFLKIKNQQKKISSLAAQGDADLALTLEQELCHRPWNRKIFVDLTATHSEALLKKALTSGFHIVLANKKPLAIPFLDYCAFQDLANQQDLFLRYEATVGAGLPVLDTIHKLVTAGDRVEEILGCLSGTLGYLMTAMEDEVPFSVAVRTAFEQGYTEPDPRDDLSGLDVARKALILGRIIGMNLDLSDIKLEGLFPENLSHSEPEIFLKNLQSLDKVYADQIKGAKSRHSVLRYVARIKGNSITVGIEEMLGASPFGRLRGTDNQVTIKTLRYAQNPLVVTGPGAGAEVTAAGVLNDIINIACSQERGARR